MRRTDETEGHEKQERDDFLMKTKDNDNEGGDGVPFFIKHTTRIRRDGDTFYHFARPPHRLLSLICRPQLFPRPRAWDEQAGERFAEPMA